LDHGKMLANYRDALKNPAVAHPHYARLDLERKTLQPDGTWSDWKLVDANKNLDVLENLPEEEPDELTPDNVRPDNLVDHLPFLKAGFWEKVHIASLAPKEKIEAPKAQPRQSDMMFGGGMKGGGGGGMRSGGMMGAMGAAGAGMMQGERGGKGNAGMMMGSGM